MGLFELGDTVGQRDQTCVLQHAQTTSSTDRGGQLRGGRPAHGSLLDRHLAADQLGEGRRQHGRSMAELRLLTQHSIITPSKPLSKVFIKARGISSSCNPRVSHGSVEPDRLDCAVVIKKGRS
jgi:hypothetical protein